jgi:dissimilatory sulfite reductase (desulfoviridin) alpha/beta subunit
MRLIKNIIVIGGKTMSKKSDCICKLEKDQTIKEVIEVLEREVSNYSKEYQPERVRRIENFIKTLKP